MSHTPGPWKAELVPTSAGSAYKFPPCTAVLYVDRMHGYAVDDPAFAEAHANANLIAAAPDLLAACHEAAQLLCAIDSLENPHTREMAKDDAIELLKDAIQKARGEK